MGVLKQIIQKDSLVSLVKCFMKYGNAFQFSLVNQRNNACEKMS